MASGRERSESIYTLLHLAFHRCKPVENMWWGGGVMVGVWFIPPFVFVFTCSSCQNCFDVICLKVTWICNRVYFHVFGFQGQPRDTDVASPILDIKTLQGILACLQLTLA